MGKQYTVYLSDEAVDVISKHCTGTDTKVSYLITEALKQYDSTNLEAHERDRALKEVKDILLNQAKESYRTISKYIT